MHERNRTELLAREVAHAAGDFIARESNRLSLITVTKVTLSPDYAQATIFVSVFPETAEEEALDFLKRQRSHFRTWVAERLRFKRVPFFDFAIDYGEKNRQTVQPR